MKRYRKTARRGALSPDERLRRLIVARLHDDPAFWTAAARTQVKVVVDDGHVTLMGTVPSEAERRRADILARVLGAVSVDNQLEVQDADPCGTDRSGARG
jgi:osmotically-inducible protein OsmY